MTAKARTTPMSDACARAARELQPAGFFVLRSPLLPFDELMRLSAGVEAPAASAAGLGVALDRDRVLVVDRLRQLASRPIVRDAIRVASPSTFEVLEAWLGGATDERSRALLPTLVRYIYRMGGRATPYGLFASQALGGVDAAQETSLAVSDELRRHTHLDRAFLAQRAAEMEGEPELAPTLLYSPTPGVTRVGDAYLSLERDGGVERLASFQRSAELDRVLGRAESGATRAALVDCVLEADGALQRAEAERFVGALIAGRVLSSGLEPPISVGAALPCLVRRLNDLGAGELATPLSTAASILAEIDAAGPGVDPERYRVLDAALSVASPVPLHVELFREGAPNLGRSLTRELSRSVELSLRIGVTHVEPDLVAFCERFRERWEGAEVPMMVAIDDDMGVGFYAEPARAPRATRRHDCLVRGLIRAEAARARSWQLDEADLAELEADIIARPADGACLWAMIAAKSPAALASGDFKLWQYPASHGGATMLGRFCHDHGPLRDGVARYLAREAELCPDTIFPEVLYSPQNRAQNVVARPTLRGFELPLFTRGSAPAEHCLDLADLYVSVRGERVRVRSARLGKWVAPRMTHAHRVGKDAMPLLRFLAALQAADLPMLPEWSWEPVYRAPHLPRVEHGRVVLALERWNLSAEEVAGLAAATVSARFSALQQLREVRRLPRFASLVEGIDQSLVVDFDNVLSCESFLDRVRGARHVVLCELFPGVDELPSQGSAGRYVAEVLVPFQTTRSPSPEEPQPSPVESRRSFAVGSEWLYAKLYASRARSDGLLANLIAPFMQCARERREVDAWFFIRYADPQPHLRIRCHGDPDVLLGRVLPGLRRALEPALVAGDVERLVLDSYVRELERYGGDAGMELCERVFAADSAAVVELLATPDDGQRWYQALLGADRLVADLVPDGSHALSLLASARADAVALSGARSIPDTALAERFREQRTLIEHWLAPGAVDDEVRRARDAFARRSTSLEKVRVTLFERAAVRDAVMSSLLHMHVNRMLANCDLESEQALLDALWRVRRARLARARVGGDRGR